MAVGDAEQLAGEAGQARRQVQEGSGEEQIFEYFWIPAKGSQ